MTNRERYPLAAYGGAHPTAPEWFQSALANSPDRRTLAVTGKTIELLTWGEVGQPGLLFLHGSAANADWWSFIAPWFAKDWRCAAISWSGMGGSDWAHDYSLEGFAAEVIAAIGAAGLDQGPLGPVIVAHSLGGNPAMIAGTIDTRIRGVICIDTAISPRYAMPPAPAPQEARHRLYPTLAGALARFRLDPPQTAVNHFIIDYLARAGLREAEDERGAGWTWRFDPSMWNQLDRTAIPLLPTRVRCPMAYMHGARSKLIDADTLAFMRRVLPAGTPIIALPDSDHHVLVDQPLVLVAALEGLLAAWPPNLHKLNAQA